MSTPVEEEAVSRIGLELGRNVRLMGDVLHIDDAAWAVPPRKESGKPSVWETVRFREAFPSSAHGDQREKLVFKIAQDASPTNPQLLDADFRKQLADRVQLSDSFSRQVVAAAIADEYWTVVQRFPYLVPYHSFLPAHFVHTSAPRDDVSATKAARYKLFSGIVLPFLCWTGTRVDDDLVQRFLDVMNSVEDFGLLDELMLQAAESFADERAASTKATSSQLMSGQLWGEVEAALQAGAYWQPAHDRFQRDLRTVLSMQKSLPRRDLLDLLTLLLSLHLALHYYRVSIVCGRELDRAIAAAGRLALPPLDDEEDPNDPLAGKILFRVGTRGDRPVRLSDPCAVAYRNLTDLRLLALPAVITTMNLAHSLWVAIGGAPARPDLSALTATIEGDAEFASTIDAGLAAVAALFYSRTVPTNQTGVSVERLVEVGLRRPGLFALREAVTTRRRTTLRNLSRDVVNQLVKRDQGSLIRTRGRVTFFELDEDSLFLLVKLICGSDQVDFTAFTLRLAAYGLAPQDEVEKEGLAAALERLGMLRRYSDAGESIYVKHPI